MNVYFIKAAILQATGIELTVEEVKQYLVSEGMATVKECDRAIFTGYDAYYNTVYVKETRTKHRD